MSYTKVLVLFLMLSTAYSEKRMVEISFKNLLQLDLLVQMDIDLDHHRTLNEVHAFVTDEEFEKIHNMDFGIKYIPNQAKLYFEELMS